MHNIKEINQLLAVVKGMRPAMVFPITLGKISKADVFDYAFALSTPFNYQEGEFNLKGADQISGKFFYSRSIQQGDEDHNKEINLINCGSYAFVDSGCFDDEIIIKIISKGINEISVERLFPFKNDCTCLLDLWLSPLLKDKCNDFRGNFLFELFKSPTSFNRKHKLIALWNKTEDWVTAINSSVLFRDGRKIFIRMALC